MACGNRQTLLPRLSSNLGEVSGAVQVAYIELFEVTLHVWILLTQSIYTACGMHSDVQCYAQHTAL